MAGPDAKLLYEHRFRLEAPPERIFAALTEAEEQVRWFTENSQALPRLHGSNGFWGRHTLWSKTVKAANQYFTEFEPPLKLSYFWELKDRPTQVHVQLAPSQTGTELRFRHEEIEAGADDLFREMVADFWRIALINLLWYLETGEPMVWLDYFEATGEIDVELDLTAPPPQIFQALTLPAKMDAWLSHQAKVELRVGGQYSFGWTQKIGDRLVPAGPTTITTLEQDEVLAYGWEWPGETHRTEVTWTLHPLNNGTRIRLEHRGFDAKRDSIDYKQGWTAFLCLLKLYLERGVQWE
jgi:uncharacterized protein YndB with AHSA1/START domain